MKRNNFLFSMLAVFPLVSFARVQKLFTGTSKGFKINAGEGRYHGHIQLKGVNANILDVKVSGKDTNGDLAIFEQTSLSQKKGTPLHLHYAQDEIFFVLEGEYYFQVGEEKYELKKGDSIFLPRNIPHAWTQVSASGKMTVTLQPAGKLEDFFVALAARTTDPSKEEMAALFEANEMKIVGPPLAVE
ncbi:cupin domain-containing protein [Chitinophaga sp. MM2321]|uniref:cupin domain-containing protein n=1 Tax=Chitinophaga sp. MM2321 TaxID=3137178 RepID=UPI0032D589FB